MTKEKKKKKNMIPIIAVLVFLVAVSSAFIGTLAKFVMTEALSDNAVVAEFGLGMPERIDLFSVSYLDPKIEANGEGKKIIAPGASGSYAFSVSGTAEVEYVVRAEVEVAYSENWDGYEPLEYSLDGEDWTNLEDFQADLSTALESEVIAPNAIYSGEQTIYWRWPFTVDGEDVKIHNEKDTEMGIAAVGAGEAAPKVTISIELTAEQVG